MGIQHNWVVQLCDYHALKFDSTYLVYRTIKDALKDKGACSACKLDVPPNIQKIDILLTDEDE